MENMYSTLSTTCSILDTLEREALYRQVVILRLLNLLL